ncbi:MAG: segregation and condensation protein A [Bdellovibrionota bacterium]
MAHRVPITVHLESFEGPLDLLLYLIQSHELDVSRVSITQITDQFVSYVRLMQELNFDTASEFLVMAATLLHWKSKALLPQENKLGENGQPLEDDGLTQEELIRQLLEHQRFLEAGENLAQLPRLGDDVFTRPAPRRAIEKVWKEMDITSIAMSYQDMLVRARKRTQVLRKETVSLTEKMIEFGDRLPVGAMQELRKLMTELPTRPEIVVTFLASLELARLKKLRVYQEETYSTIYVELLESLKGFNFQLASGFDYTATTDAKAAQPPAQPDAAVLDQSAQHG